MKTQQGCRWLAAIGAIVLVGTMSAQGALTELHRWNLGDNDAGAVSGGAGNDPTTAASGGFDLTKVGSPTYTATSGGLGMNFNNPGPDWNLPASEYYENTEFSLIPTDSTKWGVEAIVTLNAEVAGEAAVVHIGFGNAGGLLLETDGGVAAGNQWMLHIPNVTLGVGGSQANAVGQYVHLAAVANGNQLQLYENGNLVIDLAQGLQPVFEDIRIGASVHAGVVTRGWDGQIDVVRVFEYAGEFNINETLFGSGSPAQPGDFDGDGDVDGADFVAWQTNFPKATGATLAEGDGDGDGDVDGADFVVWQTNFPFTPGPGATTIPEPAGMISIVLGGIFSLAWTRIQGRWRSRS